ncbi:peptide ABC transporter ATP-binding protein [Eisenbergiella tayi]|uniref:Nickel import system ATP-binding protein NikD n=1 Tax=Eisenbergiella tayi TaxID=1432052 RepID=A0A1E3AND8_9FIRM|nr:ABC transporter ATP-binding protein [Eisenbergiella tayi]ODM10267.1 Oligopeptide transport ATP-binding protein OppD [Eisenbergiella tayi]OIZ61713.1 peptide ABC transporter ATP-binding protein [Eisenbergiella tayi]
MSCSNKFHILEIQDLSISFRQYEKGIRQVDLPVISRLNVTVHEGEIVAVVGSSGSGKSLLAHAILGLLPSNAMCSGEFFFLQEPLTPERMEKLRGKEIALVPQSVTYLDPLMKVGKQVRRGRRDRETISRQRELFSQYGLAQEVEEKYPFACSGGMSRRIMLATALMENPRLIIADEPTPGMELSLAGKAMEDFRRFADMGNGVLLITHDIELALKVADRIAVFYAGTTVEEALVSDFESEELLRHPYTKALWRAMPRNGFHPIDGVQPYVKDLPKGCVFGPRCPDFSQECEGEIPERVIRCGTVRCIKCREDHSHHHHGGKEAHEHAGS